MNVDFLTSTNPFKMPPQIQKEQPYNRAQTTQTEQSASAGAQKSGGADFVQRIKDTNDAIGFIQTAEIFLKKLEKNGISDFDGAAALGATTSYSQKPVLSQQSFDTTAGVVFIDITSSELGYGADFEGWVSKAKDMLKEEKTKISTPLAAFGAEKKTQMQAAADRIGAMSGNAKLGSILNGINSLS